MVRSQPTPEKGKKPTIPEDFDDIIHGSGILTPNYGKRAYLYMSLDGAWTQWVRTGSRPGRPPTKIVPLVFHSVWHALGMDYGRCRDGVNIRSIYADATLCFLNL